MLLKQLLLQAVLILVNAFFAATEMAVMTLNTTKLKKMEEDGDRTAARLLKMVEEPSGFLSSIQIGITLAGFLGSAFAAENFADSLAGWVYETLGFQLLSLGTLHAVAVIVVTIVLSYFTLVLGELVPKRIALQKSYEVAKLSCGVIRAVSAVLRPIVWLLSVSTNGVLMLLHMKVEAEEEAATEDEIRMMVDLGTENGTIEEEENQWIQNVFEFNDTTAEEAMTREPQVVAIQLEAGREEVLRTIHESGLSRYPVYGEDINDVLGILNARDYLLNLTRSHPRTMKELLRPAYFVPESIHADQLFGDMQKNKQHIAIVIDEYGETCGVITMEDLLEEIVGNIYDEFDPAEQAEIEKIGDNTWRVSGMMTIEDLSEALGVELEENEDYDTLGGMVLSCLNSIPEDGSVLDVDVNGLHIHVTRINKRRIEQAIVSILQPETGKDEEEEEEPRGRRIGRVDTE